MRACPATDDSEGGVHLESKLADFATACYVIGESRRFDVLRHKMLSRVRFGDTTFDNQPQRVL